MRVRRRFGGPVRLGSARFGSVQSSSTPTSRGHTSHTYLPGIELSTLLISETSKRPKEKVPCISGAVGLVMFGGEHGGKPLVTDSGSLSQTSSE